MAQPTHHDDDTTTASRTSRPIKTLLATGGTLLFLTLVTVSRRKIDFGANINLAVAMVIAVTKATLVVLFFMHLRYDRLFHTVVFVSAILAASLFVGFTLMDTAQYQQTNIWHPVRRLRPRWARARRLEVGHSNGNRNG